MGWVLAMIFILHEPKSVSRSWMSRRFSRLLARSTIVLFFLSGSGASHAQETDPQPVPREYFGMHMHLIDKGGPWPTFRFGSWRLWDAYVAWRDLEPSRGKWDFSRLDRYVALARKNGVSIVYPLGLTPAWASARPGEPSKYKPGNAAEPSDLNTWRNYVRTVASRYKGEITVYEIWNEPNIPGFFSGDVRKLVELTRVAREELKKIDPAIQLVSPGMSTGAKGHLEYLDKYLAQGGAEIIDVLGYHMYVQTHEPEALIPLIHTIRGLLGKHGIASLPLWNTESGWWIGNGDGTPEHPMVAKGGWKRLDPKVEAGAYLARALIVARGEGLGRFYWYSWDNPYGLGMIELTSKKIKPVAAAYDHVVSWLENKGVKPCKQEKQVYVCELVTDGKTGAWIVWASGAKPVQYELPKTRPVTSLETLNRQVQKVKAGDFIKVDIEPVLLF